ncbi:hypothetical protein NMG60_11008615 [Bertholletia excelsa]
MSSNGRKLRLNDVAVNIGCGSCRRPRLSSIFRPSTRTKTNTTTNHYVSPPSTTPTTLSDLESGTKSWRAVQGFGRVGGESLAVEKDSDDPYLDFRRSMLQMIVEKEIYSKDDLKELLNCFLQLNSPYYHSVIVRAFTEIWNAVFTAAKSPLRVGRRTRAS